VKMKAPKSSTDLRTFSESHQLECIARYKPYFLACGIAEAATWDAWTLWRLAELIYDNPDVKVAEAPKLAAFRASLKPAHLPWTYEDYVAAIPPQSLCFDAIAELPAETKAAIRGRVLAAKGTA
jgi:hypothetical protein